MEFTEIGYSNRLLLGDRKILENVQHIQLANGLKPSEPSEVDRKALDFTVEMETGTGKTYVYRTKDIENGPWRVDSFKPMLHDQSLFFDDDGRVYMLYGAALWQTFAACF